MRAARRLPPGCARGAGVGGTIYEAGQLPMCEVFKYTGRRRISGCMVEVGADVAGCGGGCNEGAHFPRCYGGRAAALAGTRGAACLEACTRM